MAGQDATTTQDRDSTSDNHQVNPPPKRTPLPKLQIFIVLLIQFSEPVTATVIYPFVNQFVRDTGVTKGDEKKIGFYAGIIASSLYVMLSLNSFDSQHRSLHSSSWKLSQSFLGGGLLIGWVEGPSFCSDHSGFL